MNRTKVCTICGREHNYSYKDYCANCYKNKRYEENEEYKKKSIGWSKKTGLKNRDKINKKKRLRYKIDEHHRLKVFAKNQVMIEIRKGNIKRPHYCSKCGKFGLRIEGHHEDYDKPLEVIWLCRACHRKEHRRYKG